MTHHLSHPDYVYLRELLRNRIGHDLGEGKEYLAESRLGNLVESRGIPNISTLFQRLRFTDRSLEIATVEAMLTCETSFFRGSLTFERLRRIVIPSLAAARADQRRIRIWCAACSTGQEPYSIAITLLDHFPELTSWDVSILATDISEKVLAQAREASYSTIEVRRGLTDTTLRTHFENRDDRWILRSPARRLVAFKSLNLIEPLGTLQEFDIIFLRNVLIYFCPQAKSQVLSSARRAIQDDGYLFLGESETILGTEADFDLPAADLDFFRPAVRH